MIVVFLQRTLKEKVPFDLINTLLLHIPLLVLTHRQNDRQRNKYTCYGWAGGTFFQLCCCLQNNPPENNVEPVPAKQTADYLRFGGNWQYIIFQQIVLGLIFFRLRFFLALVLGTS